MWGCSCGDEEVLHLTRDYSIIQVVDSNRGSDYSNRWIDFDYNWELKPFHKSFWGSMIYTTIICILNTLKPTKPSVCFIDSIMLLKILPKSCLCTNAQIPLLCCLHWMLIWFLLCSAILFMDVGRLLPTVVSKWTIYAIVPKWHNI